MPDKESTQTLAHTSTPGVQSALTHIFFNRLCRQCALVGGPPTCSLLTVKLCKEANTVMTTYNVLLACRE